MAGTGTLLPDDRHFHTFLYLMLIFDKSKMRDACLSVFVYHKMITLMTIGPDDNGLKWVQMTSHTKDGAQLVFLDLNLCEIA